MMSRTFTSTSRKIVGFDPGVGRLGWAVLESSEKGLDLLRADTFETKSGEDHEKRLVEAEDHIVKLLREVRPDVVAVEKVFFTKNQKTAMATAEIRGIIITNSSRLGIKIKEFTPTQVKMSVCGYGKADKNQVKKMIKMILKPRINLKHDDAFDAAAIALAGSSNL